MMSKRVPSVHYTPPLFPFLTHLLFRCPAFLFLSKAYVAASTRSQTSLAPHPQFDPLCRYPHWRSRHDEPYSRLFMHKALFRTLRQDLHTVLEHRRAHGMRETLKWLPSKEAPATLQFGKYVASGLVSTVVQLAIFTWLSHSYFPAHDYLNGPPVSGEVKEKNAIISNLIAFPFSNLCAYFLNILFVFTPGRHSKWFELTLFTGISLASFSAGLLGGPLLISAGLDPWAAQLGFMITSALVNFACRKYIVFQE